MASNLCNRYLLMLLSLELMTCTNTVIGKLTQRPSNTEVKVGGSAFFNCTTSVHTKEINWFHYRVNSAQRNDVYDVGALKEGFAVEINLAMGINNLVILQAKMEDAGSYECHDENSLGGESAKAQLIVLESDPSCQSNADGSVLVGPNSCGIEQEALALSCGVKYSGNISPQLVWREAGSREMLKTCNGSGSGGVVCNLTLNTALAMVNSSYSCETSLTGANCTTDPIRISYALSNEIVTIAYVGDTVTCSANSSSSRTCIYRWRWVDGDDVTESSNLTLPARKLGLHQCEAICSLSRGLHCSIMSAAVVNMKASPTAVALTSHTPTPTVSASSQEGLNITGYPATDSSGMKPETIIGVVVGVLVVAVATMVGIVCYLRKREVGNQLELMPINEGDGIPAQEAPLNSGTNEESIPTARQTNGNSNNEMPEEIPLIIEETYDQSMERMLVIHQEFLLHSMNPDFGLLDKLVAFNVITTAELRNINLPTNTTDAKNELILGYVKTKVKANELMESLRNSAQIHLVNYLTANGVYNPEFGEDWPLSESELKRLRVNRECLIDLLDPGKFCQRLFSVFVINGRQLEFISSLLTNTKKNEALLDMMSQFSFRQYNQSVACLRDTNQSRVADALCGSGVLLRVHATLSGMKASIDATEDQIISMINDLLKDKSKEEFDRFMKLLLSRLNAIAVRKGQSIVIYFHLRTLEELGHLKELMSSGQLKRIAEQDFNHLMSSGNAIKVILTWSEDELDKSANYFESVDSFDREAVAGSIDNTKYEGKLAGIKKKFRKVFGLKKAIASEERGQTDDKPDTEGNNETPEKIPLIEITRNYRPNPKLEKEIKTEALIKDKYICGMTILSKELFIVHGAHPEIEVYDSLNFAFKRKFKVADLNNPQDIVSCQENAWLYVMDYRSGDNNILRMGTNGKDLKSWSTNDNFGQLSVTSASNEKNIILTVSSKKMLIEYSPDGKEIRKIPLLEPDPQHAIKLRDDDFVVCFRQARVCLVDGNGGTKTTFHDSERESRPINVTVDEDGCFLVAVYSTNYPRVFILDSELKSSTELLTKTDHGLRNPKRICLYKVDKSTSRLFVAEEFRVLVF